jgi:glc operon protein GlcG
MRTKPCLTQTDAKLMMTACLAEAEKNGWEVTIAIVDDAGVLLNLERMDGAPAISAMVAPDKAKASALTKHPTKFLEDLVKERPAFANFPAGSLIQGAVPVIYEGECVGAIGVSGVQSGQDEQITRAGLTALK